MSKEKEDQLLTRTPPDLQKVEKNDEKGFKEDQDFFSPESNSPSNGALLKTFASLAVPSIVTNIMGMLGNTFAMIYAGHLDDATNLAIMGIAGTV